MYRTIYCILSTPPFWYSCPMFSLVSKHSFLFHVSPLVRQPWYIKDSPHSHRSSPEEDSSRSRNTEINPLGCLQLKVKYLPRGTRTTATMDKPATLRKRHSSLPLTAEACQHLSAPHSTLGYALCFMLTPPPCSPR